MANEHRQATRAWRSGLTAVAAWGAFVALLLRGSIFSGLVLVGRDLTAVHHPWRWLVSTALASGRLPLWNPYTLLGEPALANPQTAVFYPLNWTFVWWPFPTALTVYVAAHLLLAAGGAFVWCRRLGCGPTASALGASAFAFGGWTLTRAESPPELAACALAPWVVWIVYEAVQRSSLRWSAAAGVILALQWSSGNLNAAYNAGLAAGLCWAITWLATFHGHTRRERVVGLASLPIALLVAAGLFAVQWMPTLELMQQSSRAEALPADLAAQWAVPPLQWLRLVAPFLFGMPGYERHWGGAVAEFAHGAFYVGCVPLMLAIFGCATIWQKSRHAKARLAAGAALAAGLVFATAAAGSATGLYAAMRTWLPGFDRFHSPYKLSFLVTFCLASLTALGWDSLAPGRGTRVCCAVLAASGVALAVTFGLDLGQVTPRLVDWMRHNVCAAEYAYQFRALAAHGGSLRRWVALAGVWIALGAVIAWLASYPRAPRRVISAAAVAAVLGELLVYGHHLYYQGQPSVYRSRADASQQGGRLYVPKATAKLNWLLYGQRGPAAFEWARLLGLGNRNMPQRILSASGENALATRRYRAWRREVEAAGVLSSSAASRLRRAGVSRIATHIRLGVFPPLSIPGEPKHCVLVQRVPDPWARFRTAPSEAGTVTAHSAVAPYEQITLAAHLRQAALVETADSHYPGWRAVVDGRRTPIEITDRMFRGISAKAGRHRVVMAFEPKSVKWGAAVTLCVVAAGAAACLLFSRGQPSNGPQDP